MIEARVVDGSLAVVRPDGTKVLAGVGEVMLSDGRVLTTRQPPEGLTWEVSAERDCVVVQLRLRNHSANAVRLEQLRPLVASAGYLGLRLADLRIQETGWQSWSRAHPPAPFEPNLLTAAPPIRGPGLQHRQADSQLESWMTVLEANGHPSLLIGFITASHQLGTVEIIPTQSGGHLLIASTELDATEVVSNGEVISEALLIADGSTPDLLKLYAARVAEQMQARRPREVLTGWCSWYQLYTSVSEHDVERNVSGLAQRRQMLPLQLIQLDDGFQREVGDWLELNEKFPSGMPAVVERIRQAGFVPGLWLAPFLLSARSRTFAEHPDWVIHDDVGEPLNAIDNWGSANYALDTTHPSVLNWLERVIRTVCIDWGYDYLKLDFLYAGALRGRRFDSSVTAVEAYRRGLELLRNVAGDRFILGCGAPLLPSIGLVDGMRIGSDVAAYWGAEGNADGPSLRNATRATLARLWMHGRWWANDPDCVVVRATETELSLAEVQAWASVVALSGGMVFVGDDVSRVEDDRLRMLERLLPPSGWAACATPPLFAGLSERLSLHVDRPWASWDIIAIANWSDATASARFDPVESGLSLAPLHVFDLWSGIYLGLHSEAFDLGELLPHSLRLLSVHPDLRRPQSVGSTGHVLGEAMDVADEHWDAARHILTITPSALGPAARRGEVVVCDPNGPPRRVPFSVAVPTPIQLEFA